MDFVEATDFLLEHVRIKELAVAMGASEQSIRQARMKKESKGYRAPPKGWQKAAIKIALAQSKQLVAFAERLQKLED